MFGGIEETVFHERALVVMVRGVLGRWPRFFKGGNYDNHAVE
jgi:hypothetical protein